MVMHPVPILLSLSTCSV